MAFQDVEFLVCKCDFLGIEDSSELLSCYCSFSKQIVVKEELTKSDSLLLNLSLDLEKQITHLLGAFEASLSWDVSDLSRIRVNRSEHPLEWVCIVQETEVLNVILSVSVHFG